MTVQSQTNSISYSGNGVTTTFAYNFVTFDQAWLDVYVNGVLQTLTSAYSVTGVDNPSGGNIVFVTAPANGATIYIARTDVPATQLVDYTANDPFPAETQEQALDKLTMLVQQNKNDISRSIKVSGSLSPAPITEINHDSVLKDKIIGFDSLGNVTTYPVTGNTVTALNFINVKDYGAVGDGVTDDSAALASAATAVSGGGGLYFPDGIYLMNAAFSSAIYPTQGKLSFSVNSNIVIMGSGKTTLRISNWATQTKGGVSIIYLNNCNKVTIKDLRFEMTGVIGLPTAVPEPDYPICSAIFSLLSDNITISNCSFYSFNSLGADGSSPQPDFYYKQIPIYAQGDTSADVNRGFNFLNNIIEDTNTYKLFLLGMGDVQIDGNHFLRTCGNYPAIRNLIHASRGHTIANNYFEGLNPADDDIPNNIVSTDLPSMLLVGNATNKGGGGVNIHGNKFALTGSGGIDSADLVGVNIANNSFYDLVNMSAVFTIEDDTKSCIRLHDEASGSGSYPSTNVSIVNNTTLGTLTRKAIQITHALNGSVVSNNFTGAGYGIKATRARNFVISGNIISGISSFAATQVGVFISGAALGANETVKCISNNIHSFVGGTGTGIGTSGYTPTETIEYNNTIYGVGTTKTAGVQDYFSIDNLKFINDTSLANSDTSVIDYFSESTWTPAVTFTTPGDLAIVLSVAKGKYLRIKNTVTITFHIFTSTFTHTTASGNLRITGLPFTSKNEANLLRSSGLGTFQAISSTAKLSIINSPNTSYLEVQKSDASAVVANLVAADTISGQNLLLTGELTYHV